MRANLKLLLNYEAELKLYDSAAKLRTRELRESFLSVDLELMLGAM